MSGSSQKEGDDLRSERGGDQPDNMDLENSSQGDSKDLTSEELDEKPVSGVKISKSKARRKQKAKKKEKTEPLDLDEYSLGGIKYRIPGKRQRIIVASIVLGLNLLLLLAVVLYFKNPEFREFIYNVGREV